MWYWYDQDPTVAESQLKKVFQQCFSGPARMTFTSLAKFLITDFLFSRMSLEPRTSPAKQSRTKKPSRCRLTSHRIQFQIPISVIRSLVEAATRLHSSSLVIHLFSEERNPQTTFRSLD